MSKEAEQDTARLMRDTILGPEVLATMGLSQQVRALNPSPESFCALILAQAKDFKQGLKGDQEMRASVVLADGSVLVLQRITACGAHHLICNGESLHGLAQPFVVPVSAATLKLEAVPASDPVGKQPRIGFRAQVEREAQKEPRPE